MPTFERYVGDILADSPRVRALMLNGRREKIGDEGARRLAAALLANTRMNRIFLGRNKISSVGASALADSLLRTPAPLAHFTTIMNSVDDGGAASFAEVLRTNGPLVSLRLEGAGIRTAGAVAIAGALRGNSTLQALNLSANFVGCEAAAAFLNAMRRMDDAQDTLNGVVDSNHTLHSLKVDWYVRAGSAWPPEAAEALRRLTVLLDLNKRGPEMARRLKIGHLIDSNPLAIVTPHTSKDAKLIPDFLAAIGRSCTLGSMHIIVKQMPTLFEKDDTTATTTTTVTATTTKASKVLQISSPVKPVRPPLRPLKQTSTSLDKARPAASSRGLTHEDSGGDGGSNAAVRPSTQVLKRKRPQLPSLKHPSKASVELHMVKHEEKMVESRDIKSGLSCLFCEWSGCNEASVIDSRDFRNCDRDHSYAPARSILNPFRLCIRI